MTLRTRKPTGTSSHPCILIEGPEKVGKSWMAAEFSGDDRIGMTYWIDLAEGDGDLYGAVPGARYEIVEHEGTYASIYEAIADVHAEAKRAREAGEKPVMLVIDPIGPLWAMLKDWAYNRAAKSESNKKLLAKDPNAEINVGTTYWNPATDRWRRCMTPLLTFPGVVLLLARGKEVAAVGRDGNPVAGQKEYRVEAHKSLGHDVTVSVRMSQTSHPRITGGRSVRVDMRPENYRSKPLPEFSLPWLLFEALGYDPETARTREGMELHAGDEAPESERALVIDAAIDGASSFEDLARAQGWIAPAVEKGDVTAPEAKQLHAKVIDAAIDAATTLDELRRAHGWVKPASDAGHLSRDDAEGMYERVKVRKPTLTPQPAADAQPPAESNGHREPVGASA